jgi:hypothetical protein
MTREEFENTLSTDDVKFAIYAKMYMGTGLVFGTFLDWSWNRYQKEFQA